MRIEDKIVPIKNAATKPPLLPSMIEGLGSFMRGYRPLSYPIEGILPSGALYGLTARQGTGKTAFMQAITLAVAMDRPDILGLGVKAGRVAYVTIENPDDFRMKMALGCFVHNIRYEDVDSQVAVVSRRDTPEQIVDGLRLDAEANGPFRVVCFDTFQAGFSAANGGEFNSNDAVLAYTTRLRALTTLPGSPGALVAFHPTKNAGEDELFPYGGGAIMNEIDGNLTLWKSARIKLGHNRLRGPEFEPKYFQIEKLSCPEILDDEGAQILLPVMKSSTQEDAESREQQEGNAQLALLMAMLGNETGTQRDWAATIGKHQGGLQAMFQKLKKAKFVEERFGKWILTETGRKTAKNA